MPFIMMLFSNPLFRNLLVYGAIILACYMGYRYVQDLRQTAADQLQQITALTNQVHAMGDTQIAQKQVIDAQVDASRRFAKALTDLQKEVSSYNLRHAIPISELVKTDPNKAQQQIADEYKYRLECLEFMTGKAFPPAELALLAPYCEAVK